MSPSEHHGSRLELLGRFFRLSSAFRLVETGDLTQPENRLLGDLCDAADIAAVLIPQTAALSAKAICRPAMRLLESFRIPSVLSSELLELCSGDTNLLLRLVLDSVLEIEHDGRFVTGAAASGFLKLDIAQEEHSRVLQVSLDALRYGEELAIDDAPELSERLYSYNRIPISPYWARKFNTPESVDAWCGLAPGTTLGARLDLRWEPCPPAPNNPGWRHFHSREHYAGESPFKLYVSSRPELLPEVLAGVEPVFHEHAVAAFKVGADVSNILRPDNLVAYMGTKGQLLQTANKLADRLRGIPARVVPFAGPLDADGLLSWGMDPPREEHVAKWQGVSWRRWITDRLAVALIAARVAGAPSPSRFALLRLSLEGIDVRSWTPNAVSWARS